MTTGGRRGRRTSEMVRLARERIDDLFALAEEEATDPRSQLPDRYTLLARKVGMRYNARLPPEYRELYCRGCSAFWVEGRTVRTRLRAGCRVRTCLVCGRARRVLLRPRTSPGPVPREDSPRVAAREEEALTGPVAERYSESFREPGSEED